MKADEPNGQNPQDQLAYRVAYLIAGYIQGKLTESEHDELDDWVSASMDNQQLFEKLINEKDLDLLKWKQELPTSDTFKRLKNQLDIISPQQPARVRLFWPWIAAASVLLIVFSYLFIQKNNKTDHQNYVQITPMDIGPGTDRASLTLADGTVVALDNKRNGTIATQGNINIIKKDSGLINYQMINPSVIPEKEAYNTLATPAGGQFKLVLPDGTKVWLNASSSLKYPTVFHGSKRKVELTGEGYFEVTKDPLFPFEVSANNTTVQVLGTHFDINAYTDEPDCKVTLSEGSVKVNNLVTIKPNEQAQVTSTGEIKVVQADVEAALAWKDGQFLFKEAPLNVVMRQVARWYNAHITYEASINDHFNADIPRDVPVSKLLHLLEGTGRIHFKIENAKITVMK